MENKGHSEAFSTRTLNIGGMHCQSCVGRVETALLRLSGVVEAAVDLAEQKATIRCNSAKVRLVDLKASLEAEGYQLVSENITRSKISKECCNQPIRWSSNPRAYLYGMVSSLAIVGVYLGMNTLIADWYFARVQFIEYRWWIILLAIGLGAQVTLFALFKANCGQKMRAAKSSMAASGGVSVTAMMACCSHYLATVVPALGVPFLSASAVASLAEYQPYFFLVGVISCLVGIGLMLRMMVKHGMIQNPFLKNSFIFRPGGVGGTG